MSNQNESVQLICGLLSCHTPSEQNNIINDVLSIVAKARALDFKAKSNIKEQASSDLELFIKITSIGENNIEQAFSEVENTTPTKASN